MIAYLVSAFTRGNSSAPELPLLSDEQREAVDLLTPWHYDRVRGGARDGIYVPGMSEAASLEP